MNQFQAHLLTWNDVWGPVWENSDNCCVSDRIDVCALVPGDAWVAAFDVPSCWYSSGPLGCRGGGGEGVPNADMASCTKVNGSWKAQIRD